MRIHSPSPHKLAQSKSSDYFFNYFTLGVVSRCSSSFAWFLHGFLRGLNVNSVRWRNRDKLLGVREESFVFFFPPRLWNLKKTDNGRIPVDGCFPLCQRFRNFRSIVKWKGPFWVLLTGILRITSGGGPHISVERFLPVQRFLSNSPVREFGRRLNLKW